MLLETRHRGLLAHLTICTPWNASLEFARLCFVEIVDKCVS